MRLPLKTRPGKQQGFGLVEILVGVLIGMIGIVVIFQVLQLSEERKRTTGAGSDAQISGSIGMYSLSRDLQLAGYGFGVAATPMMGCSVSAFDNLRPVNNFNFGLSPIVITKAQAQVPPAPVGAPDTISVLWGNSSLFVASQTFDPPSSGTSKHTQGRPGFQPGDLVVAATATIPVPPPQCALVQITSIANTDAATIDHTASQYNPPGGSPLNAGQGFLYNLGPSPRLNVWSISKDNLTNKLTNKLIVTDDLHWTDNDADGVNDPTEIADGIINLQAQYGYDANANNMIEEPPVVVVSEWMDTLPPAPDWTKVRAIRVALLARSQQYEKTAVTTVQPSWAAGPFTMTNVDGTPDSTPGGVNDWRNYRYRVYQVVIPLRNMIWGTI
jgi:type IV pilus assembly protein PilW